ncbi:MAG TPA: diadenylate cyclase [Saprospiraceae bacterium]|nr:diadenylate cyclase [Saprospiraceae bacterium]MCB9269632.1 diadenylate cyclase [Lewinellaceae bacterium]HPG06056.1 diadenylate cyclase [Saprospiraceae bacterium]HPQ98686.1 diadenylate cyclase [Saprospiraceae bacterium]HRV86794.1 diadenylate cyclase [Saprospiraceae bacterium]
MTNPGMHIPLMIWAFKVGILEIRILDILDIAIVAYLLFSIYKLLKGSVAFNIFIGLALLYGLYVLVNVLDMKLLSLFLTNIGNLGVILLIIIFQPEIRRFLLYLGNTTLKSRADFFRRIFPKQEKLFTADLRAFTKEIAEGILALQKDQEGALIILEGQSEMSEIEESGEVIDAQISGHLITSIFRKESPLHDGAVLIKHSRIAFARCILPVSAQEDLPDWAGLRHRAGLGVSEIHDVLAIIVSEETGNLAVAEKGELTEDLDLEQVSSRILKYL